MTSDFAVALHALGFLTASDGRALTSATLARTYGTNPVVVRRVLIQLKAAGLVGSQRGVGGGSVLAKDPKEITLKDVFLAVHEAPEILSRPPGDAGPVSEILGSYVERAFSSAESALLDELSTKTIAEMDSEVRPKIKRALCQKNDT